RWSSTTTTRTGRSCGSRSSWASPSTPYATTGRRRTSRPGPGPAARTGPRSATRASCRTRSARRWGTRGRRWSTATSTRTSHPRPASSVTSRRSTSPRRSCAASRTSLPRLPRWPGTRSRSSARDGCTAVRAAPHAGRARRGGVGVRVRLDARAYRVPTDAPEADGTLAWSSTTRVVVEAGHDGVTGAGWTYGPAAAARIVTDLLAPAVRDTDPDDVPAAWVAMQRSVRNAGRPGVAGLALSAADCAVWDLKARRHGLPLATLLGAVRRELPVYGSGGFTTYDDQRQHQQLAEWVHEQGIPRVKIKIGESW